MKTAAKVMAFILALTSALMIGASADGIAGGETLTWTLQDGVLTISGTGAMTNYDGNNPPPWEARKPEIASAVIGEGVSSVGSYAFSDCSNMTDFRCLGTVETVGVCAFRGCGSLTEISFPEGLTSIGESAFESTGARIVLPDTVTSIGTYAFMRYTGTQIILPDGLTDLGYGVFWEAWNLTGITIPEGVETIPSEAFAYNYALREVSVPSSLTAVQEGAFKECSSLTDVYFAGTRAQAQAIRIGANNTAFGGALWHCSDGNQQGVGATEGTCGGSVQWSFDGSVLSVSGDGVMGGFDTLNPAPWTSYRNEITELVIADGVTSVSDDAFRDMPALTVVRLPDSITSIGRAALADCSGLTDLTIPDQVTEVPEYLLSGCTSLTSLTLPVSIETIGDYLFFGCDSLTSVRLPSSLTSIGFNAFYGCESLASVAIPESVTFIGTQAFCGCSGLAQVSLPDGKVTLGESVFEGCRNPCCISMIQLSATAARFPTSAFLLSAHDRGTGLQPLLFPYVRRDSAVCRKPGRRRILRLRQSCLSHPAGLYPADSGGAFRLYRSDVRHHTGRRQCHTLRRVLWL